MAREGILFSSRKHLRPYFHQTYESRGQSNGTQKITPTFRGDGHRNKKLPAQGYVVKDQLLRSLPPQQMNPVQDSDPIYRHTGIIKDTHFKKSFLKRMFQNGRQQS